MSIIADVRAHIVTWIVEPMLRADLITGFSFSLTPAEPCRCRVLAHPNKPA